MTIYKSVADAARKIGLCDTQIGGCCRGIYTSCTKDGVRLVWMYYDVFLGEYAAHNYEQSYIDNMLDAATTFAPSRPTRSVVCLNTGECFESLADASRATGIAISGIQGCAIHRNHYAGISEQTVSLGRYDLRALQPVGRQLREWQDPVSYTHLRVRSTT